VASCELEEGYLAVGRLIARKTLIDDILFDSLMEAQAYILLKNMDLIDEAWEGSDVHVKVRKGRVMIEVDFLLKDGTYLDIHHFDEEEDRDQYLMNREWIVPGEYVVVGSLEELKEVFLL